MFTIRAGGIVMFACIFVVIFVVVFILSFIPCCRRVFDLVLIIRFVCMSRGRNVCEWVDIL